MAGKRDSRRHSTTRFSENVAWREQVIKCKRFHRFAIEEGLTSSSIINRTNFFGEKMKLPRMSAFLEQAQKLKLNLLLVLVLVFKSKALFCFEAPFLFQAPSDINPSARKPS